MRESQTAQEHKKVGFIIKPIILGIIGGLIISIILLGMMSFVFTLQDVPQSAVTPLTFISVCGGAFMGGFFASRSYKNKGLMLGALTGLLFFFIIYMTGVFMNQINSGSLAVLKLVLSVLFGSVGGVVGVNTLRKH